MLKGITISQIKIEMDEINEDAMVNQRVFETYFNKTIDQINIMTGIDFPNISDMKVDYPDNEYLEKEYPSSTYKNSDNVDKIFVLDRKWVI